jgi:hypothetical protein
MTTQEALEVFECMQNLTYSQLLSYLCKKPERIRQAAKLGADAMREIQRLHKLLECWEEMNDGR